MYAFQHAGIVPDVVILSKAIGGGLPVSVVVYHKDLDRWAPGAHAGTFRGNQMAMATGTATITFIQEHRVVQHAEKMGARLMELLHRIQNESPSIGDCRGRGLMIGAEIINREAVPDGRGRYPADPNLAQRIQAEALRLGLILEVGGRHNSTVRFLPPLIVTSEQIDTVAAVFAEAVNAVERDACETSVR